jgi:hypothetical protein
VEWTEPTIEIPVVVSYGVGVNSGGLLKGMQERGNRPDAIVFSDTGGERDEVYKHLEVSCQWCLSVNFPPITVVKYDSRHGTLEQECINNVTLPSLAFGFRGCSVKWKRQPIDKWVREWPVAIAAWEAGLPVARYLGIHAGEQHRGNIEADEEFIYDRPLVRWGWGQAECEAACIRAFGYVPKKSACFYCPAMKKREVLALAKEKPDLFARAVAMERNAKPNLGSVKGLGRNWTWEQLVAADEAQLRLFSEPGDMPCLCED